MSHYVKFTYQRARADITPFNAFAELNAYRRKLLEQHLMGVDSNGVGFGNVSVRDGTSEGNHRLAFENGFHERISLRHDG